MRAGPEVEEVRTDGGSAAEEGPRLISDAARKTTGGAEVGSRAEARKGEGSSSTQEPPEVRG